MTTTISETTFAKAYLQLLHSQTPKPVRDTSYIGTRGQYISIPEFPTPKKKAVTATSTIDEATALPSTIKVTVKSIKAPKFNEQFELAKTDIVLDVREKLNKYGSSIKLLVKGKVIPESRSLQEVAGDSTEIAFMAMVSGEPLASKPEPTPTPDTRSTETSTAIPWEQIEQLLISHMGQERAAPVLEKFKSSVAN